MHVHACDDPPPPTEMPCCMPTDGPGRKPPLATLTSMTPLGDDASARKTDVMRMTGHAFFSQLIISSLARARHVHWSLFFCELCWCILNTQSAVTRSVALRLQHHRWSRALQMGYSIYVVNRQHCEKGAHRRCMPPVTRRWSDIIGICPVLRCTALWRGGQVITPGRLRHAAGTQPLHVFAPHIGAQTCVTALDTCAGIWSVAAALLLASALQAVAPSGLLHAPAGPADDRKHICNNK